MFDDGNPGSPVIALEIINESLANTNFKQAIIKSCFIELIHFEELRNNIAKYKNAMVISGKYEDVIEQQLKGKQSQNVFLYIDPYGVKSLHFSIFGKLSRKNFLHSIELLINLNSFGFIREACSAMNVKFDIDDLGEIFEIDNTSSSNNQKSIDDLTKVAGGEYWKGIIEDYKKGLIDGYEAEKQFSDKYCEKLSEKFEYVLNMPIRLKKGQRPKYRMIHATNHAKGCVLMNDNMCKRWEALQDLQNQGQISLFFEDVENKTINKEVVQKEILDVMSSHKDYIEIDVFHAKFVSRYGVRFSTSEICKEIDHLCNTNKLEVKRYPETTETGKPSKFWTTSRGKKVKVRCL
ncbi:hypothetical protein N752_01105 [Desulforamulus aquiferis]|nr:three-Cys-motif partner protein TcmP [Desulforamulus aquiferis]RYD07213.1 hypothetical protein N752_01105 [Desulforamulus aquiferis]